MVCFVIIYYYSNSMSFAFFKALLIVCKKDHIKHGDFVLFLMVFR